MESLSSLAVAGSIAIMMTMSCHLVAPMTLFDGNPQRAMNFSSGRRGFPRKVVLVEK